MIFWCFITKSFETLPIFANLCQSFVIPRRRSSNLVCSCLRNKECVHSALWELTEDILEDHPVGLLLELCRPRPVFRAGGRCLVEGLRPRQEPAGKSQIEMDPFSFKEYSRFGLKFVSYNCAQI